jgi:hypothetical protein
MRQKALLALVALVTLLLVVPTSFAANLVTNGSFETSDFTGWTEGGNFEFTQVVTGPFYVYTGAEDGDWYATMGPVGGDGTLSQTLATNPGTQYTFSFWLNAVGDDPSDFSASWDGTTLYSQADPNTGGNWTQFSFSVTGTGSDTIMFAFDDDPAYIALDNVSVSSGSTTPEPGSLLLFGSGVVGLAGMLRRKLNF